VVLSSRAADLRSSNSLVRELSLVKVEGRFQGRPGGVSSRWHPLEL